MRNTKSKSINRILFENEDLFSYNSQIFVIKGLKKNYNDYQQFYLQSISEISKLDQSLDFEENSVILYNFIKLEDGEKLLNEIYSYLKIDVKGSKYDFFYEKNIFDYIQILNESTQIFLLCITEKEYITIYWEARP